MNNSNKAVFFDCWDTVISFQERTPSWNVEPLKKHALNPEEINFKAVEDYSERFLRDYMNSRMFYEIDAVQFYNLMVYNFNIKLDCTTKECIHEILNHLNPEPLEGIMDFLKRLERDNIYYAILSNTIYDEDDTFAIIKRKLPDAHFNFFLGSSKIAVKKPYELFFNTGLNLAHKRKEDSIYIGDSFYADIYGANNTAFNNCIYLNTHHRDKNRFSFIPGFDNLRYEECFSYKDVIKLYDEGKLWK